MTAVFISYSRADQDFVRRLHAALDGLGRDAWVDWQGIAPTAEWMAEIRRAIDGADATLFILSPAWVRSKICAEELEHAVRQGKRLVPVVWRDSEAGSVPEALARLNWVMLREGDDFEQGLRQLVSGLDTDLAWVRDHTRLIVRAQQWESDGGDEGALLRGRDLQQAERWMAQGAGHVDPAVVPLQAAYITRSREAATRRQRITLGAVIAALVIAVGLAIWAFVEQGRASRNAVVAAASARAAEASASAARFQEGQARRNEARAVTQEGIARAQTARAEDEAEQARLARDAEARQREAAQAAQHEAERQRDAALARQLAARAQSQATTDPAMGEKAALLAIESLRVLPNLEADQVLRQAIARLPPRRTELAHEEVAGADALDSAGNFLAFAETRGTLHVVDTSAGRELARYDAHGAINHLHVDRGGRWVVFAKSGNGTWLFNTAENRATRIENCDVLGGAFGGRTAALLALGCHRELRLIDLENPSQPVRTLPSDEQQLALAFSPDGEQVAGVDAKGDIRAWRLADGKLLATVKGQESESTLWSRCCTAFIGFSASGRFIASSNLEGGQLHIVSTETWSTHARLPHPDTVNVFAFDERRDLIATGQRSGRITVWELQSKSIVSQMSHGDEITQLRLYASPGDSARAPRLLSASTDRTARVWDPFNGEETARAAQATPVIWVDRTAGPNAAERFASLDSRTRLAQWDMQPLPQPLDLSRRLSHRVLPQHCVHPDGHRMWFIDANGVVAWDAVSGATGHGLRGAPYGKDTQVIAIDPSCRWVAFATPEGLRVVAPDGNWAEPIWRSDAKVDTANGGQWQLSPGGSLLSWQGTGVASRAWRTSAWGELAWGEDCKPRELLLSPAERLIAAVCADRQLRALDVASGREIARLKVEGPLALSDDGLVVWGAGTALGVVRLVDGQETGRAVLPEALGLGEAGLSPDGRTMAWVGRNLIRQWRLPSLTVLSTEDRSSSPSAVFEGAPRFSPDSRHLLVAGTGSLYLFDTGPWKLRSELIQPGALTLVQWDLVGRRLLGQMRFRPLARDVQFTAVAWDLDTGAELQRVQLAEEAGALRLSADQRFLLADQVYRWSPAELASAACRLVSRNLTRREWRMEFGDLPYRTTCSTLGEPAGSAASWDQ